MSNKRVVKDLMKDVFDFPHIPYWFTVKQAIGIVKKSLLSSDKCHHPMAILVFDEKYNLMGTISLKDILKGLEPQFLKATKKAQVHAEDESGLSALWEGSKEAAEKQVSEIMVPAKVFVQPNDPASKAAYLMLHNDLVLLPVLEDKKKFVGLVRMIEVFDEISNTILEG
jgi:Mg/Co/Ni transporter MgtE